VLCLSVNAEFQEKLAGYIATARCLVLIFCKNLWFKSQGIYTENSAVIINTTPFIKTILSFFLLLILMEPSLAVADLKTNRLLKNITLPPGFKIQL
jgi:hypothetical protein